MNEAKQLSLDELGGVNGGLIEMVSSSGILSINKFGANGWDGKNLLEADKKLLNTMISLHGKSQVMSALRETQASIDVLAGCAKGAKDSTQMQVKTLAKYADACINWLWMQNKV